MQDDDNINDIEDKTLLKNILELCSIKQGSLKPKIVLDFVEKALQNVDDSDYITSIDQILNKFDRLYFNEIKINLNEILYNCYHITTSQIVKLIVIRRVKYFKLTRMFKNKMEDEEKEFYNNNVSQKFYKEKLIKHISKTQKRNLLCFIFLQIFEKILRNLNLLSRNTHLNYFTYQERYFQKIKKFRQKG